MWVGGDLNPNGASKSTTARASLATFRAAVNFDALCRWRSPPSAHGGRVHRQRGDRRRRVERVPAAPGYRTIFRDVYIPKWDEPPLDDRIRGAWLWSRRRGVIAGAAASALHGAQWIDADTAIELVSKSARPQRGLIVRNETLAADEVTTIRRLPVTSVARTAFDLGRHLPRRHALARLDALMRATPFSLEDVSVLAKR